MIKADELPTVKIGQPPTRLGSTPHIPPASIFVPFCPSLHLVFWSKRGLNRPHVRLTRGPDGAPAEMLRRGYSFRTGHEEGLLFVAFQRDLEQGFAGVQRRLAGEPLSRYTLTVGGGYYFLPPAGWTLDH